MNDNYAKWLESENKWVQEAEAKIKKAAWRNALLIPVGAALVCGVIAVLAGGMENVVHNVLQNLVYGLIFGIVILLFYFPLIRTNFPVKKHMKSIKAEIENVLSQAEREEFASQMMGIGSDVKCVKWLDNAKNECRVYITQDFALYSIPQAVLLVQLKQVDGIKSDKQDISVTTWGSQLKITQHSEVYTIDFTCKGTGKDREKTFVFQDRDTRWQVRQCLQEVSGIDVSGIN